jgi:hypothetical protein
MNTKLDLKSAMLGLVLGLLAIAAIGAVSSPDHVGRYQVSGTGDQGLVVDTVTGQV